MKLKVKMKPKAKQVWIGRSLVMNLIEMRTTKRGKILSYFCLDGLNKFYPAAKKLEPGQGEYIDVLITKSRRQK